VRRRRRVISHADAATANGSAFAKRRAHTPAGAAPVGFDRHAFRAMLL